jgi:hypothetical protein
VTIYPTGEPALGDNFEIATVTDITGDVLTITRAQESTAARTIVVGDQVAQTFTAGEMNRLESEIAGKEPTLTAASKAEMEAGSESALRSMSPLRVAQAIAAQAGTGGTPVETATHAADSKTPPVDADELPLVDSEATFGLKKLTWANLKTTLKTYFDSIYSTFNGAYSSLSGIPSTFAPSAHKTSHENGGADEISVAGLSGELADPQPPKAHTHALTDLSDVTVTSPAVDEILKFNGSEWINGAPTSSSASNGVDFFPDDTTIIAAGAENTYPVKTLSRTPIVGTEDVDSITLNNNTVPYGEYLYDTALGSTSIESGVWNFDFYCGVSSAAGISSLSTNVMRVRPGTGTVSITGTGTSRTAIASSGTPFATAAIDASATQINASWLRTPKGLYQITARASDTEVTIATPTGYGNESTVAYSVHKKLFNVSSGEINNVATTYATMGLITVNSVQPAYTIEATDKLAAFYFGTSDASRIVYFSHNGSSKYTHFHSPLTTRHNDLAGINAGDVQHLTVAQKTAATAAQAQGTASIRAIGTTTPEAIGTAAAGSSTEAAAKDHVHAIPADAVTNAMLANMAASTLKGNKTTGSENPTDLTVLEAQVLLNPLTSAALTDSADLAPSHQGKVLLLNSADPEVLTVRKQTSGGSYDYPVGMTVLWYAKGAGQWTFTPSAGDGTVVIRCRGSAVKTAGQYAMGTLVHVEQDVWVNSGDVVT